MSLLNVSVGIYIELMPNLPVSFRLATTKSKSFICSFYNYGGIYLSLEFMNRTTIIFHKTAQCFMFSVDGPGPDMKSLSNNGHALDTSHRFSALITHKKMCIFLF